MPEKKPLKIFHILLSRGFAGSERSTAESCNQQCRENDVWLVIRKDHRKGGASILDHLDNRVNVIQVNSHIFTRFQIKRLIVKYVPDVIHCHLRRATRLAAQISPSSATVSTLHIEVNGPHFMKMSGLICNARWQVEKVPSYYEGSVFKASNSLVPHRRLDRNEISSLRSDLGLNSDEILIGAVGRYHESKAWDTLIAAFKELKSSRARLYFFGSGRLEGELKLLAKNDKRIKFIGYRSDVKDLYQCFDVLVCPSRYEPLPRVMLEAYDAGLPVVASDTGGCKELVEDYGGWCFPTDNVGELTKCLNQVVSGDLDKRYPDLSAHHVENANEAMLSFYRSLCLA